MGVGDPLNHPHPHSLPSRGREAMEPPIRIEMTSQIYSSGFSPPNSVGTSSLTVG